MFTFTQKMQGPSGAPLQLELEELNSPAKEANSRSSGYSATDYKARHKGEDLDLMTLGKCGLAPEDVAKWLRIKLLSGDNPLPLKLRRNYRVTKVVIEADEVSGRVTILIGVAHPPLARYLCQVCTRGLA